VPAFEPLASSGGAMSSTVVWAPCVEVEGAPGFWPWRQVPRSLGVDPASVFAGEVESAEDLDDSKVTGRGRGGVADTRRTMRSMRRRVCRCRKERLASYACCDGEDPDC
jgi:hypothetical protein